MYFCWGVSLLSFPIFWTANPNAEMITSKCSKIRQRSSRKTPGDGFGRLANGIWIIAHPMSQRKKSRSLSFLESCFHPSIAPFLLSRALRNSFRKMEVRLRGYLWRSDDCRRQLLSLPWKSPLEWAASDTQPWLPSTTARPSSPSSRDPSERTAFMSSSETSATARDTRSRSGETFPRLAPWRRATTICRWRDQQPPLALIMGEWLLAFENCSHSKKIVFKNWGRF